MYLRIHVLCVGQGDSLAIEFPDGSWGVIDSNVPPGWQENVPPLLKFLIERRVTQLAFVCLTHPHADHYRGLLSVLKHFEGNVGEFWSTLGPLVKEYLRFYKEHIGDGQRAKDYYELTELATYVFRRHPPVRHESLKLFAPLNTIGSVAISAIAPPGASEQTFLSNLTARRANENLISAALMLEYRGRRVILGGDVETPAWNEIRRRAAHGSFQLPSDSVKVSHHGSASSYTDRIWSDLTIPGQTIAAISSGGDHGFPSVKVLSKLANLGNQLYCTMLNWNCCVKRSSVGPTDYTAELSAYGDIPAEAQRQLFMTDRSLKGPGKRCQGIIQVQIDHAGAIRVQTETNRTCQYRLLHDLSVPGNTQRTSGSGEQV